MLKRSEKFGSLFRSKVAATAASASSVDVRVTQCYSVTTGKVSTLVRSASFSTVSSHSSASFDGDGDDESDNFPPKNPGAEK
jgi:hypothetical protein